MGPPQGSHVLHRLRGKHEKSSSRPVPSLFNYFLHFCLFPAWVLMTGFGFWLLHCLVFAYFLLSMIFLLQMDPGSRKSYKCEHCQKSFCSKYRLSFHVRNNHSFAPPQMTVCSFCDKRFSSRSNLNAHINLKHLGERKFACTACGKRYGAKKDLDSHTRQHHNEEKLKCDKCGSAFGYKSALGRHKESCGKKSKTCKCPTCGKMFVSRNALYMHKRGKHSNEVHICEVCGKSFERKFCHARHVREVHKDD